MRRLRVNAGWLGLLALLVVAASLLLTASPRMANRHTDAGLREWVESLSYLTRDVSYRIELPAREVPSRNDMRPPAAGSHLASLRGGLPPALAQRLSDAWYSVRATGEATGTDLEKLDVVGVVFTVREQSGADEAVRMVAGTWPDNARVVRNSYQVAISTKTAETFGLAVGSTVDITGNGAAAGGLLPVQVAGIFEPIDRTGGIWVEDEEVFEPYTPTGVDPPEPWRATLLSDTPGMTAASERLGDVVYTWRFRVDGSRLDAASLPALTEAAFDARRQSAVDGATTITGLDSALARFAALVRATQALLAVVQTGVAATLFGLVVLAALAAMQRRHNEFALLRSRGGSLLRLGGRVFVECLPVVLLAVVLGQTLGRFVPGRPGAAEWLTWLFAGAALLIGPVLVMAGHRRASVTADRTDLATVRATPRRLMAELTVVVLAVLATMLLRRRGLGTEVDLYLVLVPVLVGVAAAVVTLRVFPYPLRLLAALASRARGAVPFLGLARAGRAAPATAGPLAVLVVAVSVGAFCLAVQDSVAVARDRVADLKVPGTAIVQGGLFSVDTAGRLARVPGVSEVAFMSINFNSPLASGTETDARPLVGAAAVVVDADELARVLAASGSSQSVPQSLLGASQGGAVPAVVSPEVAAELSGKGSISVQSYPYGFTVAEVLPTFPGLSINTDRFVVLPRQALVEPTGKPVLPTSFAIAGSGFDTAELARVGDQSQRDWISSVSGRPAGDLLSPTRVLTYTQARADLERGGVDRVLAYTFLIGSAAGLALALLAVGFSVASGARARGQALSRLRTMGLAPGQGRRLIAYELLPLIGLGALVGAVVGAAIPRLIGPALGLSAFSDGAEVVFVVDPRLAAVAFAIVVLAVAVAMVVEAMINRRARLGAVLRVGGEG